MPESVLPNGEELSDPLIIAETFNGYFVRVDPNRVKTYQDLLNRSKRT